MELHDYQREGALFLQERKGAALFLDMGLGKTAIALSALTPEHLPALVIAPKRVAEQTWPEELSIWRPELTYKVAAGPATVRDRALRSGADVVLLGRDNIQSSLEPVGLHHWNTVILDELSSFKSPGSKRFKALRRMLRQHSPVVWGLTGTPTPNGLLDLWSQVFLLDQGQRLGPGVTWYRNRYFTPGRQLRSGVVTEWQLRPGAESRIHRLIEDICLSMGTEGRVHVPPVTVNRYAVDLPAGVKKVYAKMKRDLVADMEMLGGGVHSAMNAAVLTNKLSQLTAGFMYGDEGIGMDWLHNAKLEAVQEIVEGSLGSPVLVFYRYRAELDKLRAAFPQAETTDSSDFVKRWNEGTIPVLLAHPASAGHGLNLQRGGHTIVWTSPTWSLEEDMQANKRLARQGQKNPVVIHYLTARGTVDEAILERLRGKATVQEALMKHLEFHP